jgi:hypothetical protein
VRARTHTHIEKERERKSEKVRLDVEDERMEEYVFSLGLQAGGLVRPLELVEVRQHVSYCIRDVSATHN